MRTGKQGAFLKSLYTSGVKEQFRRNNVWEIEVVSENDSGRRNEEPDLAAVMRLKRAAREDKSAMMVHVEGTMDPGRINPETRSINGMVDMDLQFQKLLLSEFEKGKKGGKDIVFLPVAIDGGYIIYDPNTRKFTKRGLAEIALSEISLMYGFPHAAPFGSVNIGEPFRGSEIRDLPDPIREIMLRIAKNMPYYARGKYK